MGRCGSRTTADHWTITPSPLVPREWLKPPKAQVPRRPVKPTLAHPWRKRLLPTQDTHAAAAIS